MTASSFIRLPGLMPIPQNVLHLLITSIIASAILTHPEYKCRCAFLKHVPSQPSSHAPDQFENVTDAANVLLEVLRCIPVSPSSLHPRHGSPILSYPTTFPFGSPHADPHENGACYMHRVVPTIRCTDTANHRRLLVCTVGRYRQSGKVHVAFSHAKVNPRCRLKCTHG